MDERTVITIGREFGSGGHEIGMKLAEKLGIKCYDKELLEHQPSSNSGKTVMMSILMGICFLVIYCKSSDFAPDFMACGG